MITRILLFTALTLLSACGGGGSFLADGGQSGTGIFALVTGNVSMVEGSQSLSGIRVAIVGTDSETETDQSGAFEFETIASGSVLIRFERASDSVLADADVVVPFGGTLRLREVVLADTGEAEPTEQEVEFDGFVDALGCEQGLFFVQSEGGFDDTVFTVETESATIERDDVAIECRDLVVGEQVEIEADTTDGVTLINARVEVEDHDGEDDGEDDDGEDDDGEDDDGEDDDGEDDDGEDDGEDDDGEDDDGEDDDGEDDGEDDDGEDDDGEDDDGEDDGEDDDGEDDDGEDDDDDGEDDDGEDDDGEDDDD